MNTPTIAANTSARNEPVPTVTRISGMMMNTDDAGVIDDSVIITLPSTRSDRDSSCSYTSSPAGLASRTAAASVGTKASSVTAASNPKQNSTNLDSKYPESHG